MTIRMKSIQYLSIILLYSLLCPSQIEAKDKKYKNGDFYSGEWKKGKPDGHGKMIYANGDIYEGDWIEGIREGSGKLIHPDGSNYIGEWHNDKVNGKGKMTFSDNTFYEGDFVDDEAYGEGYRVFPDGMTYKGIFKSGKWAGNGTINFPDNSAIFTGIFNTDVEPDDELSFIKEGTLNTKDGYIQKGKWINGIFYGLTDFGNLNLLFDGSIDLKTRKLLEGKLYLKDIKFKDYFIEGRNLFTPEFEGKINFYLDSTYLVPFSTLYNGEFRNGKFTGQISGDQLNDDIIKFDLKVWEDGHMCGDIKLKDGSNYSGNLKDYQFNNTGIYEKNNIRIVGMWNEGNLIEGTVTEKIYGSNNESKDYNFEIFEDKVEYIGQGEKRYPLNKPQNFYLSYYEQIPQPVLNAEKELERKAKISELENQILTGIKTQNILIGMTGYPYGVQPVSIDYKNKELIYKFHVDDWDYVGTRQECRNRIIRDLKSEHQQKFLELLLEVNSSITYYYYDDGGRFNKLTFTPKELKEFLYKS